MYLLCFLSYFCEKFGGNYIFENVDWFEFDELFVVDLGDVFKFLYGIYENVIEYVFL